MLGTTSSKTELGAKNPPGSRRQVDTLSILFLVLALLSFSAISALKIDAFRSWRYTADIFPFDTAMTETLRGNVGLDFYWGNSLGDHSYLFLLLLTPVKLFLGNKMIYLLLLLGPICYLMVSTLFYFVARKFTDRANAFIISIIQLFGFSYIFPGLYEHLYGMHPEVIAGYLLLAITCLLLVLERVDSSRRKYVFGVIVILLLSVTLLKEEMTLIAAIFFFVVFLLSREKKYLYTFLALTAIFITQLMLIEAFRTPFNRSTSEMVAGLIRFTLSEPRSQVIRLFFTDTYRPTYWAFVVGATAIYYLLRRKHSEKLWFIDALFVAGIIKILFSIATVDYNLYNFHNFPGVLIVVDAFLLRMILAQGNDCSARNAISKVLLVISLLCVMTFDAYFFYFQVLKNIDSRNRISAFTNDLEQMKKLVDPDRVVSIQHFSHKYWIGNRYTTYPRGVTDSPTGLADYIIFPIYLAQEFSSESRQYDVSNIPATFEEDQRNENFVLFKRIGLTEIDRKTRAFFAQYGINEGIP